MACGLSLGRVASLQYSLLESDAMVEVGVARGEVDCGHVGVADAMQSFDEGIVHWGEAIVRCGYEYTAASQFRDEAEKVPSGRVGDYFASEALGCAAGKRSHALSSEAGHEPLYGCSCLSTERDFRRPESKSAAEMATIALTAGSFAPAWSAMKPPVL